ncbi:hypothetical protein GALL_488380 [mine drainage metagenome]|uniref:Uncharacterized protein n=1 Tax=mine drainage metagenome TaxID=410659 RepID=A0A1J5PD46_9ZZZZ
MSSVVRDQIARINQRKLDQRFADAQNSLGMAIETAQMVFWELDLANDKLHYFSRR